MTTPPRTADFFTPEQRRDILTEDLEYWRKFLLRARTTAKGTVLARVHIEHLTCAAVCIRHAIEALRAAPSPGAGETLAYPRVIIDRGDVRLVQTSPPNSYLEVRRVSDNSEVVSTPCVVTEPKDEIIQLLHLAWLRSVQAQPPAVSASPASPASRKAR